MSSVFEARFAGWCALGCDGIKEGDEIRFAHAGATVPQHVEGGCRYVDELALKRPVCESCNLELLPTGDCPDGCGQ